MQASTIVKFQTTMADFTARASQLVPDVVGQLDDGLAGARHPEVGPGGEVVMVNGLQNLVVMSVCKGVGNKCLQ